MLDKSIKTKEIKGIRLCVAPMMDWTDRHCRYFHRLLAPGARLYTEMVHANAVIHGDRERLLGFDGSEHPLALQLGGSDPALLAQAARIAQEWGYDEVNLNCGCPSDRVQAGRFGACLMREPALVAECVGAMVAAVDIPVTVKCRLGVDDDNDYETFLNFVDQSANAGSAMFVVHARNAWLKGLSPKENREVPPLRYDVVAQLKRDFPQLTIAINGGFKDSAAVAEQLEVVDGVMVGREAYHNPWWLASWDAQFYGAAPSELTREAVEEQMVEYMEREALEHGTHWYSVARHMLGLRHGLAGARRWRQVWSDHRLKGLPAHEVMAIARQPRGAENGTIG